MGKILGLRHKQTLLSGAVVQEIEKLKRKGDGSGIEGQWTFLDETYRVLTGEITLQEQAIYDTIFVQSKRNRPIGNSTFQFKDATLDKNTVELTGQKTMEKVRIFSTKIESRTYTSTVTGHDTYTYDQSPKTCPIKPFMPVWYIEFLIKNIRL